MEWKPAEAFIRRSRWLSQTPDDFQDRVLAKCDLLEYLAGASVYEAGDDPGGLFGVVQGHIGLHLPAPVGAPTLALIGGPGFWAGDLAAVTGRRRRIAIAAGSDCQMFRLSRVELMRIAAIDPSLWRHTALLLAQNLAKSIDLIDALKRNDPGARLAAVVLNIVEDMPPGSTELSVSQGELAAMARLSRSAVNATLKALEGRHILKRRYSSIEVIDLTALSQIVWGPTGQSAASRAS